MNGSFLFKDCDAFLLICCWVCWLQLWGRIQDYFLEPWFHFCGYRVSKLVISWDIDRFWDPWYKTNFVLF